MSEPKFKLNDQVFVCSGFRGDHKTLTYIERVTPSGLLGVKGHSGLFREDGYKRGSQGWTRINIIHATEERKAVFVLARARGRVRDAFHNGAAEGLDLEQCKQILEWVTTEEKEA